MNILHIDSSPSGDESFSRRFSAKLVAKLKQDNPGATVTYRDLVADPFPHVNPVEVRTLFVPDAKRTPEQDKLMAKSDTAIAELKAADIIVIGSPMYNFSITTQLKAWIDHVVLPGKTFNYGEKGPVGALSEGKKLYLIVARGGVYSEGPFKPAEHQDSYLKAILGFIGLKDVTVIPVEGVSMGEDAKNKAEASAEASIEKAA